MCNFSGMIKNVLPSLRQRAGPQRICSRQKSIRSCTARDSFSQTPRMRGKGGILGVQRNCPRITPAHAGKRRTPKQCVFNSRDHPRVCGEKISFKVSIASVMGSPPHVRGKEKRKVDFRQPHGITPACAGKSCSSLPRFARCGDHPRMCGEKRFLVNLLHCLLGSPPHVRGKGCGAVRKS